MSRAVDEINRLDGIVPVTPQAVAELIAEIKQLRAEIERLRQYVLELEDPYYVKAQRDQNERLRAALDDCAQARGGWKKFCEAENQAEIERLRAALQDIAEDPYAVDGGAAELARAALEPKP